MLRAQDRPGGFGILSKGQPKTRRVPGKLLRHIYRHAHQPLIILYVCQQSLDAEEKARNRIVPKYILAGTWLPSAVSQQGQEDV